MIRRGGARSGPASHSQSPHLGLTGCLRSIDTFLLEDERRVRRQRHDVAAEHDMDELLRRARRRKRSSRRRVEVRRQRFVALAIVAVSIATVALLAAGAARAGSAARPGVHAVLASAAVTSSSVPTLERGCDRRAGSQDCRTHRPVVAKRAGARPVRLFTRRHWAVGQMHAPALPALLTEHETVVRCTTVIAKRTLTKP